MKKLILACMGISLSGTICAQINIGSVNYNTVSMNETNALQAIVLNNGSAANATASITCRNSGGDVILEAVSKPFALAPGMNTVSGISIGYSRFSYGTSAQAAYLKNNGIFPSGNFSYCLKIDVTGFEGGDLYCEEFTSATDDFLSLVVPYDGDTLDTKLPVLTWTHSEPFNVLAQNEYYKIVVAEIKEGQSAEQAILSNPNVYFKNFLNNHSVPYPQDAKELEDGKTYAWQVQKISNNIMVNKTDVWKFSFKKEKEKTSNKYVWLKTKPEGDYYTAYDDKLYFRFDEEYTGGALRYEILNEKNEKLVPVVRMDNDRKTEAVRNTGANFYEMDLNGYSLKKGYYTLTVLNAKKEKFYLRFYVEK